MTVAKRVAECGPLEHNSNILIANQISLFQDNGKQTPSSIFSGIRPINMCASSRTSGNTPSITSMKGKSPARRMVRCLSGQNFIRREHASLIANPPSSKHIRIKFSSMYQSNKSFNFKCPVFSPLEITNLYAAKCKDLKLDQFENQETRFVDFCNQFCVEGKILLREVFSGFYYVVRAWRKLCESTL
jgi:hypothetical protein